MWSRLYPLPHGECGRVGMPGLDGLLWIKIRKQDLSLLSFWGRPAVWDGDACSNSIAMSGMNGAKPTPDLSLSAQEHHLCIVKIISSIQWKKNEKKKGGAAILVVGRGVRREGTQSDFSLIALICTNVCRVRWWESTRSRGQGMKTSMALWYVKDEKRHHEFFSLKFKLGENTT